ncbi:DUF2075 domain-containing protein [Vulcanococcus limneticus Candia 3F8]|uniref:DUF2075 domain-containing protein n=1 Tax=Vulcanococcus limneticus TaxID=2170428 RepID=UPI000B986847|nr:DUF2075 domain-containing protein [Vulcanococcus limneticus]MCP9793315.1 DUF2075 domain-containing protein [Vulcanococcus limneticus MW73D5]MCP9895324.1 DUF2075 domain-containing protein [Vulcanococcus limneticus Candia 3F8]MCP9898717.1 DUF2075 domain-containing protein [Vulcanococcus limneticus Candia 3B3]
MNRYFYKSTLSHFATADQAVILGQMAAVNSFDLTPQQRDAWVEQITVLKEGLAGRDGDIYFEYSIPRMGRRVDAIALIGPAIFVIEFKVGEKSFQAQDLEQVMDYGLDLANFHEGSHDKFVIPILIATEAPTAQASKETIIARGRLFQPMKANRAGIAKAIELGLATAQGPALNGLEWEQSRYKPTPTIIEATLALYRGHSVADITKNDAGDNLTKTSASVSEIIRSTRRSGEKAVCFVTGVPGAGKTLVGLDIATRHINAKDELYSVYLSGNGPLVAVLQEALARDKVLRAKEAGEKIRKGEAQSEVKAFVQNIYHFRDEGLHDLIKPPIEHVAIFDEAQRAWTRDMTIDFMKRKKNQPNFCMSEPEFLISCMNRHQDWAVIVCLVGGGQEINTGEAGIGEWIESVNRSFPDWKIYVSDNLLDPEFGAEKTEEALAQHSMVIRCSELHLKTSIRSFRSDKVSSFVKYLLDVNSEHARTVASEILEHYPLVLTRDIQKAKAWLKVQARGSERYGIVASSKGARLRPLALDVKAKASPVHWFLNGRDDVRSSFFMEDVATEFDVQGLELDWVCVAWDADYRYAGDRWDTYEFRAVPNKQAMRWNKIKAAERKSYLKNAYRVLLTRARQGMVILVPEGLGSDVTRKPEYYDTTYEYLAGLGMTVI